MLFLLTKKYIQVRLKWFTPLVHLEQELAQKELSDRDADMDFTKAAAQLAEAAARIKTIQKLRKNK